jgi:hypothetical protein
MPVSSSNDMFQLSQSLSGHANSFTVFVLSCSQLRLSWELVTLVFLSLIPLMRIYANTLLKYAEKQSRYTPRRRLGERRYSSYSFLTSALDGGEWSASLPAALCPGERTLGTHCTGGWVGPRAELDSILCPWNMPKGYDLYVCVFR